MFERRRVFEGLGVFEHGGAAQKNRAAETGGPFSLLSQSRGRSRWAPDRSLRRSYFFFFTAAFLAAFFGAAFFTAAFLATTRPPMKRMLRQSLRCVERLPSPSAPGKRLPQSHVPRHCAGFELDQAFVPCLVRAAIIQRWRQCRQSVNRQWLLCLRFVVVRKSKKNATRFPQKTHKTY